MKIVLSDKQMELAIKRLANQIYEKHIEWTNTVIIGMQPRGINFSKRIIAALKEILKTQDIPNGVLDITFYRDDVRKQLKFANTTDIPFSIEGKDVILVDDVLWKGRTVRAALDALLDYGRPAKIELCVLIDRKFSREFPIQPDYAGVALDTIFTDQVKVNWKENEGIDQVLIQQN